MPVTQGQDPARTLRPIDPGPVRQALKMLRAQGPVTEQPRRGTYVDSLTAQDVRDMHGLRAAIEGAAVKRLCRLSGNRRLPETFRRYIPALRALLRIDERVMPSIADVAAQHRPVVAAIRAGDGHEAERLVTGHSDQAVD